MLNKETKEEKVGMGQIRKTELFKRYPFFTMILMQRRLRANNLELFSIRLLKEHASNLSDVFIHDREPSKHGSTRRTYLKYRNVVLQFQD